MSCTFPKIPTDLLDDIISEELILTYSLVAASVPGLDNLHLMSQFMIEFAEDPKIFRFVNETVRYRMGSNVPIEIFVSTHNMIVCNVCEYMLEYMLSSLCCAYLGNGS